MKAFMMLLEFNIYEGNLELDTTPDMILDYNKENKISHRVLSCDLVHNSSVAKPRCFSARVEINLENIYI